MVNFISSKVYIGNRMALMDVPEIESDVLLRIISPVFSAVSSDDPGHLSEMCPG